MAEAIMAALDQSRANPSDVGYINAHGSGTKQNDRHETAVFKRSLGPAAYQIPVSASTPVGATDDAGPGG
jgi:3-oxoacyl-(acyl-carrier-protein) synthase